MDALTQYLNHIDGMIRRLDTNARRQLSGRIGRILRQRRKESIKANTTPDGAAHPARKTPDGTPMTSLRKGQQFLYNGKIRRFKTMRNIGGAYIGWEYTTRKPFTARKDRIKKPARNQLMFRKLNQFRFLRMRADANEAAIGFFGGLTGYIAAAHQDGFSGRPERQLLGLSAEDMRIIEEMIASHLEQQS
ncbi:phage virion morphogenesis protein [Kingella pumchi]|uniref:Phage virion morphogenesis protein n=1 Tax=Kingella pumchi TaxID=2779506 RepID=A0ABS9NN29_9NEIS|nr:phage virion morphogenesis protein [Kingella pumchi]MCG6503501.1 phage virion morphogenesis protein [Kingella pumchi]